MSAGLAHRDDRRLSAFKVRPAALSWTVYLYREPSGRAVYIGSTRDPAERDAAHRRKGTWWSEELTYEVHSVHDVERAARSQEAILLHQLQPWANRQGVVPELVKNRLTLSEDAMSAPGWVSAAKWDACKPDGAESCNYDVRTNFVRLRTLRLQLGATVLEVAEEVDIWPSNLTEAELGVKPLSLLSACRLSELYDVPLAELVELRARVVDDEWLAIVKRLQRGAA